MRQQTLASQTPFWKLFWHRAKDHGGLDDNFTGAWLHGHGDGPSVDALGNRWADKMAKMDANTHALPEQDLIAASTLRNKLISILHWIGRAATLHMRPHMPPSRTPKVDSPVRTAAERRILYLDRNGPERMNRESASSNEVQRYDHTQFVSHSVGAVVGVKMASAARSRMRDDELAREESINPMAGSVASDADVRCNLCGKRRQLVFNLGVRGRAPCLCLRLKRRRLTHKQPDHTGAFDPAFDAYTSPGNGARSRRDAGGHRLMAAAELTVCWSCGSYSTERVHHLGSVCIGAPGIGQAYRLRRLKSRRHPLTNLPLDGPVQIMMAL